MTSNNDAPVDVGLMLPGDCRRLRKNRTFRVRDSLDQQLIDAARVSGRSVSEEIEFRLEVSFLKGM